MRKDFVTVLTVKQVDLTYFDYIFCPAWILLLYYLICIYIMYCTFTGQLLYMFALAKNHSGLLTVFIVIKRPILLGSLL